jgi:hypothetical protein
MNLIRLPVFLLALAAAVDCASAGTSADEVYPKCPPGVVVDHLPAKEGRYVGSPSTAYDEGLGGVHNFHGAERCQS